MCMHLIFILFIKNFWVFFHDNDKNLYWILIETVYHFSKYITYSILTHTMPGTNGQRSVKSNYIRTIFGTYNIEELEYADWTKSGYILCCWTRSSITLHYKKTKWYHHISSPTVTLSYPHSFSDTFDQDLYYIKHLLRKPTKEKK